MRKCIMLAATLLLCAVPLFAQRTPLTPYEYGHRWYFVFQGGPLYFSSEYNGNLIAEGRIGELFSVGAGLGMGYNITDAHEIRFIGNYSRKTAVCEPYIPDVDDLSDVSVTTYTYKFRTINFFADYLLNYNALAENFVPFTAKIYGGLGFGYSYDFTEPGNPEVWVRDPNLVPGLNLGFILEYDFKDGFGLYSDLGAAVYYDRYNGIAPIGFPLDLEAYLQVGLIYHFPLKKTGRR